MTASLADVARRARVSVSTVSRVVSGSGYRVAARTRARVEQAAQELAYTPNALARALATRRSKILAVLVGVITDPYFAEITRGIEDHARGAGYLTIVCNTDRNPSIELGYLRLLRNHHAEGIILTSGILTGQPDEAELAQEFRQVLSDGIHVVATADRGMPGIPFIGVDDEGMLRDLARYLISIGHKRLGVVAGPAGYTTSESRLRGFKAALSEAGLQPIVYAGGLNFESGREAASSVLAGPLPDAIVGLTDEAALGVVDGLRAAGVKVPDEVSVAGVNDTRDAQLMGLTTVRVPAYELGSAAVQRILGANDQQPSSRVVMLHRIVPRSTTRSRRRPPRGITRRTERLGIQPSTEGQHK